MEATDRIRKRVLETTLPLSDKKFGFRRALGKLEIVASDRHGTMATDGLRVYVNEDFAASLSDSEFVAVLEHEVLHVALRHPELRVALDPMRAQGEKFNLAADMEINSHVWNLPDGAVLPEHYGFPCGKGTVWYFRELMKKDENTERASSEGDGNTERELSVGDVLEPATDADGNTERALSEGDVAEIGKEYGLGGTNAVMDVENDAFNSDIVRKLLRMVRKRQQVTFSRQKQSRADRSLFGRSSVKRLPVKYAVYVDISGSMHAYWKYFDSFLRQLDGSELAYRGMFDTHLHDYDPTCFGGGTDMREVSRHVAENGYTPIVFTDGYYRDVPMPPDTVYVLIPDSYKRDYGKNVYRLRETTQGGLA